MVMPAPPQNLHGHDGCGHDACGPSVPHTSPFFTVVSPTGICRLPSLLLQIWAPELTAMDAERMSLFMRLLLRWDSVFTSASVLGPDGV